MSNRLTLDQLITSEPLLTDVRLTPAQLNAGFLVNADIATTRFGGPAIASGEPPAGATQWVWALSGGGAKGAFQLGAILFLARDLRYAPLGIAATSVGSMNALGAAERTTAGTIKLRATWLSLQTLDDMYELQPWVAHLDAIRLLRDQDLSIAEMMKGSRPRTLHPSERMVDDVDPLADISSTVGTIGDVGGALASPGGILVNAMVVTPLMMPLVAPALPVILPFLAPVLGGTVERFARDIGRILDIVRTEADGLFNFAPMRAKLAAQVDEPAIAAARTRLRLCMVDLRSQSLVYCDERHELFRYAVDKATGRINRINIGALHDKRLMWAAIASSSIRWRREHRISFALMRSSWWARWQAWSRPLITVSKDTPRVVCVCGSKKISACCTLSAAARSR